MANVKCPQCDNSLIQKSGQQTKIRIHGPVVFTDGRCLAKCYWCKRPVELPMILEKGAGETFVISRRKASP